MVKLERKLDPDEFIQTFSEVNKNDHQRPPIPGRLCFAEASAAGNNSKAGPRNAITSSKTSRRKNIPSFIIAPEVRRMWLPKAIEEEVKT